MLYKHWLRYVHNRCDNVTKLVSERYGKPQDSIVFSRALQNFLAICEGSDRSRNKRLCIPRKSYLFAISSGYIFLAFYFRIRYSDS